MASVGEGTGEPSAPLPIRLPIRPRRQIIAKPDKDLQQSITNQTYVSLRITKQVLLNEAKEKNLVFSPLTIQVVLGILASATRGETLAELLSFLKSESVDEVNSLYSKLVSLVFPDGGPQGGPLLNFVNSVWIDQTVVAGDYFKRTVHDVYKAALDTVDFRTKAEEVRNEVNLWADKATNGLINQILPPDSVDSNTRLIFANALYFKGAWIDKFDPRNTKEHDYHLLDGTSVKVPFMTSGGHRFVSEFDGFKVLNLSYEPGQDGRRFSMYFFLPDTNNQLSALTEKLTTDSGFIECHLPRIKEPVGDFRIPKFKISFDFEASGLLKELGLVLPFSARRNEILDSYGLCVSDVFHKSFIEVNEKGAEAAAVTAVCAVGSALRRPVEKKKKIDFVADHPFLFVIREDVTGVVLFIGRVLNPAVRA